MSVDDILVPDDVKQVVLIDDSISKVVEGAKELSAEKPFMRPLMERFTLAAFGASPDRVEGLIVPGVVHVVSMPGWADTGNVIREVRRATR